MPSKLRKEVKPKDTAYVSDTLSHRIHVWVYLPTFTIKKQPNVGKYTIHGSHGFSTTSVWHFVSPKVWFECFYSMFASWCHPKFPVKFWCHQRYQASTALQSILFKTRSIHSRSAECHVDRPIGSMYGIFNNIYHKKHLNVGKYTYHTWIQWEMMVWFFVVVSVFFWSRTPICVSRNWSLVGNFPEMVSWTSLPLRQVKDTTGGMGNFPLSHTVHQFKGPFRGAFNVSKMENGGFEENGTVLLVVFIVVLQIVTRIKVPRLLCNVDSFNPFHD